MAKLDLLLQEEVENTWLFGLKTQHNGGTSEKARWLVGREEDSEKGRNCRSAIFTN